MKNVLWSSKVWREPWNRFFVGGCKKEHKLCPYGPDQSWRWWPPIMRRFAPTHLLLSSEFQTLSPIRSQSLSTFLLFFFIFFFLFFLVLFSTSFLFGYLPSPIILRHSFIITLFSLTKTLKQKTKKYGTISHLPVWTFLIDQICITIQLIHLSFQPQEDGP